jgi:hypothetical protein
MHGCIMEGNKPIKLKAKENQRKSSRLRPDAIRRLRISTMVLISH